MGKQAGKQQSLFSPDAMNPDQERSYKRVAIVEDFFHIIYNVHVEMDGRGGKHAGQKRTYRAVSESDCSCFRWWIGCYGLIE
ncbi:hypothetical protein ACOMHN_011635 [Nucella lapillus]